MSTIEVDPITLQVIGGALHTIAKEMGHVLYRMSYSSIIRESEDLGAGLFDANCNTLCESDSTPMHIGSIPAYLRGIEETLHDPWQPGDVVIHNHPYYGASHSPDIAAVAPVFYEGELVGFSANTAHHVDIGAATPGLIIDAPDVFAEGMLFKGVKLYEGGVRNRALWHFISANTRVPDQVLGDIEAQVASVELGVKRFIELLDLYGKDVVFAATEQLMDYSEAMLRKQIALIPDGEYRAEGFLDDDGRNRGITLPVKVCVRIAGDSAEVDLTGSSPQVPTAFNVPFEGSTKVACYFAFRAMLLDSAVISEHVPQNEGSFRPIKVTAPLGSIFNPKYPAAAEARFNQIQRVVDCIIKALAPVIPDKVTAGCSADVSAIAYSGVRPEGNYWVFIEVNEGAYGGRPESDGPDGIEELMRNTRNNPIEDLESHLPLRVHRYELRDEACPPGRWRGGIGSVREVEFLEDGGVSVEGEGHVHAPWGFDGGSSGETAHMSFRPTQGNERRLPSKLPNLSTRAGDRIEVVGPSGGGYGNPFERDPIQVCEDVIDGYLSPERALTDYGVVITEELTVDDAATTRSRAG